MNGSLLIFYGMGDIVGLLILGDYLHVAVFIIPVILLFGVSCHFINALLFTLFLVITFANKYLLLGIIIKRFFVKTPELVYNGKSMPL